MSRLSPPALLAVLLVFASGCEDKRARRLGQACGSSGQCESNFCYKARCLDPEADDDLDGLLNVFEELLNTDPFLADSDGDGIGDLQEVGGDPTQPLDDDGDNPETGNLKHNALESAVADVDLDCVVDQKDEFDDEKETDAEKLYDLSCPGGGKGVCALPAGKVGLAECVPDRNKQANIVCPYVVLPAYEDVEGLCDGLDNDCDGASDENLSWYNGVETFGLGDACPGVGACSELEGVVECGSDGKAICSVNLGGSDFAGLDEEVPCNNVDDDCSGSTDDGVLWTDPDGVEIPYGEKCEASGICASKEGIVECDPFTGEGRCSTLPGGTHDQSKPEGGSCNGLDEDCDGLVDEDFALSNDAGEVVPIGSECGTGACAGGVVKCQTGKLVCSTASKGSKNGEEICNGIDDDCDGETDEAAGLLLFCPKEGVCADLVPEVFCAPEGGIIVCSYLGVEGYEHEVEQSCNGLDDDCDGFTDEALKSADGLPLGATCSGHGACGVFGSGVVQCDPAPVEGAKLVAGCSVDHEHGAPFEECNGVDDDCDGKTDEGDLVPADVKSCPVSGVCAAWADSPYKCSDGEWLCPHLADKDFEAEEVSCDAEDNDCDGLADEGVPKAFTGKLPTLVPLQPTDRRVWHAAVPADGLPFVFGGASLGSGGDGAVVHALGDAWRFDPSTGAWTPVPFEPGEGPGPRIGHAMTWEPALGLVLVHGGYETPEGGLAADDLLADPKAASGLPAREDDLWAWNPASGLWQEVAPDLSSLDEAPARSHHTLTPRGGGKLLLHGGRAGDSLPATLVGTLEQDEAGALSVRWEAATSQAKSRVGHAAAWFSGSGLTVLAGGSGKAGLPFAELLTASPGAVWAPAGTAGNQPAPRLFPAVGVAAGTIFVAGGTAEDDPAGLGSSALGSEGWMYSLVKPAWKPLALPAGLGPLHGSAAWTTAAGQVGLLGGSGPHVPRRVSATLDPATTSWSTPEPWAGPEPRHGAAVAFRRDTGQGWLLGGHRKAGDRPLQDAFAVSPDLGVWTPLVPPVDGNSGAIDKTRPRSAGASAIWDPVAKRVLLFGGLEPGAGGLSATLWSFDPSTADFKMPDAQGEKPEAALLPIFDVTETGTEAWLVAAFHPASTFPGAVSADTATALEPGTLALYRLELATLTWTLEWKGEGDGVGPQDVVAVAGGVGGSGLRVVTLRKDGSLLGWTYDDQVWTQVGTGSTATYSSILGFAYDRTSDRSLVVTRAKSGAVEPIQANHQSGNLGILVLGGDWTDRMTGAAVGFHPSLGAVGFGGIDDRGVVDAVLFSSSQKCL